MVRPSLGKTVRVPDYDLMSFLLLALGYWLWNQCRLDTLAFNSINFHGYLLFGIVMAGQLFAQKEALLPSAYPDVVLGLFLLNIFILVWRMVWEVHFIGISQSLIPMFATASTATVCMLIIGMRWAYNH